MQINIIPVHLSGNEQLYYSNIIYLMLYRSSRYSMFSSLQTFLMESKYYLKIVYLLYDYTIAYTLHL